MRLALRVGLAIGSVLLSLLAGEAFVRLFRADLVDTNRLRQHLSQYSILSIVQPTTSPGLFFELKPNLSTRFLATQIATGPEGYRIEPNRSPQPADGFRIAWLGDSTPFGWGVEHAQSYPQLTRNRLEAHLGRAVELRNFSVPGYNSEQQLAAFEQKVVPSKPDLVVVHHDPNDAEPVGYGFALSPDYLAPEYGDNLFSSSLLKLLIRTARIRTNQRAFTYDGQQHRMLNGYIVEGNLYDRHVRALESMVEQARRLRIPIVIILFNARVTADDHYKDSELYQVLHRRLQERFEKAGCSVLDLFPFYQQRFTELGWKDSRPVWRMPDDAHPNPAGHRLIADAVANYILSQPNLVAAMSRP